MRAGCTTVQARSVAVATSIDFTRVNILCAVDVSTTPNVVVATTTTTPAAAVYHIAVMIKGCNVAAVRGSGGRARLLQSMTQPAKELTAHACDCKVARVAAMCVSEL